MKNQEVIVYAKAYNFKNDEGKLVSGGEIHILGKSQRTTTDFGSTAGHKVGIFKVSAELAETLMPKVPALCDIEYDIDINRDNAVVLKPKSAVVVKEFKTLV